jgi:hypothetical protein
MRWLGGAPEERGALVRPDPEMQHVLELHANSDARPNAWLVQRLLHGLDGRPNESPIGSGDHSDRSRLNSSVRVDHILELYPPRYLPLPKIGRIPWGGKADQRRWLIDFRFLVDPGRSFRWRPPRLPGAAAGERQSRQENATGVVANQKTSTRTRSHRVVGAASA